MLRAVLLTAAGGLVIGCGSLPFAFSQTPGAAAPAAVANKLRDAESAYDAAVAKARKSLSAAFAAREAAASAGKLPVAEAVKIVERLRAEQAAFEADPTSLPTSIPMKTATAEYKAALAAARRACDAAFDRAAEECRRAMDLEAAKAVLVAKSEFAKKYADDFRTRWEYAGGKLWFQAKKDGFWVELARPDGGVNGYREVARNRDYIEIVKVAEATTAVRLYDGYCDVKFKGEDWKLLYKGEWAGGR